MSQDIQASLNNALDNPPEGLEIPAFHLRQSKARLDSMTAKIERAVKDLERMRSDQAFLIGSVSALEDVLASMLNERVEKAMNSLETK